MNKCYEWLRMLKSNFIEIIIAFGNFPNIVRDMILGENIKLIILKVNNKKCFYLIIGKGNIKALYRIQIRNI